MPTAVKVVARHCWLLAATRECPTRHAGSGCPSRSPARSSAHSASWTGVWCVSQPRREFNTRNTASLLADSRAIRLATGTIRRTDNWAGLTIMFARRLPPPCNTRTIPTGSTGTRTSTSLGFSSISGCYPACTATGRRFHAETAAHYGQAGNASSHPGSTSDRVWRRSAGRCLPAQVSIVQRSSNSAAGGRGALMTRDILTVSQE